ncbi:hypothetical protein EV201_0006 [Ancylomarina subtilis]|uniref:Uncharacterized protein n=1 Tax=Ancylomarina subtilis TaxID=1639035 RepID=A0A4Q7VH75_9BACT|nr:hypothetical protein EV201_0006 [Ancylomarina subtilis]
MVKYIHTYMLGNLENRVLGEKGKCLTKAKFHGRWRVA